MSVSITTDSQFKCGTNRGSGQAFGLVNAPANPDLATQVGRALCSELLEPLQERFGRVSIRSGYRSAEVNALGHKLGLKCASNRKNAAGHIWDLRDDNGHMGATACVVVPEFWKEYRQPGDWRVLADWVDANLNYSRLCFFPRLWAFNIQWHEVAVRRIRSYSWPRGIHVVQSEAV